MPINAGYEYFNAEKKYFAAQSFEEKKAALEEMIRTAPKHKSSEKFVAEIKNRLRKLIESQEKAKKIGKSSLKGVKKEGFQCVLIGLPSSGKSSLLACLTNARPAVSPNRFTTKRPEIGTMDFSGVRAQIVDMPSIGSEYFDIGTINTADLILIAVEKIEDIPSVEKFLSKAYGKKLIIITKTDLLDNEQLRKLYATLQSKKLNSIISSSVQRTGIEEIKEKIFKSMDSIRVYTKEPSKIPSKIPITLPLGSTVKDVAESILKGFSQKVKETRLTGPSSKFPNQKVGLGHILKDLDIVEFHTK